MSTSYCYLTKSATRGLGKIMGGLVLFGSLVFLAGCPKTGGGTKDQVKPTVTDPTPPGGSGGPAGITADGVSVSLNENGPETMVDLPYKSQGGAIPTTCEAKSPKQVTLAACACSDKVCRVGVKPQPGLVGDGSFEFTLSGKDGVSSKATKANVKILEVNLTAVEGGEQEGTVGESLGRSLVVVAKNSDGVAIPGVEVFWSPHLRKRSTGSDNNDLVKGTDDWLPEQVGKLSPCDVKTNNEGLAQCTWTLGTRLPGSTRQSLDVSPFYGEGARETQIASFAITAQPGPVAVLSFWDQEYETEGGKGRHYYGPTTPKWWMDRNTKPIDEKSEKVGTVLGAKLGWGYRLIIFARDQYGNPTPMGKKMGASVTLSIATKPPGANDAAILNDTEEGIVPVEPFDMIDSEVSLDEGNVPYKQGTAQYLVFVNRPGTYAFAATPSDTTVRVSTTDDDNIGASFVVAIGEVDKLSFSKQPIGAKAGMPFETQPVIHVMDKFDNLITTVNHTKALPAKVKVEFSGPGEPDGVIVAEIKNGVAKFSGLSSKKAKKDYKLYATAKIRGVTYVSAAFSEEFTVTPGDPVKLAFSVQPGPSDRDNPTVGAVIPIPPTVSVLDAYDNVVDSLDYSTANEAQVTLTPLIFPPSGSLGGRTTRPIVKGLAAFRGLKINTAAGKYKLTATGSMKVGSPPAAITFTPVDSEEFDVDPRD